MADTEGKAPEPAPQQAPERARALAASFERIGSETMRGLPFYNEALAVEALDFERFGDEWLGVLITPWFMNLVLVPVQQVPYSEAANGTKRDVELPGGTVTFRCGGTADCGLFHAHSLASPMDVYKSQEQARAAGRRALARLRMPAPAEPAPVSQPQQGVSRRTLFSFAGRPLNSESPN
jgi:[NiFe] hydrogenase assembly HybE family chaperone